MDSLLPLWSGSSLGTNGFVGRFNNEVEKINSGGLVPISESAITENRDVRQVSSSSFSTFPSALF